MRCLQVEDFISKPSSPDAKWMFLEEWIEVTDTLGYETITEMLSTLYDELQSIRKVAKKIGFSSTSVRRYYHKMGKQLKPQGGANNPWGVKRKPENRIRTKYKEELHV